MQAIAGTPSQRIDLSQHSGPKVHHIPGWDGYTDPRKLEVIAQIIRQYGKDPRIATLVVTILQQAGIETRDYTGQAAALLEWVQENIYYLNEPGERLQAPWYTLEVGYGDCDDMVILLNSFYEACALPWKLVITGNTPDGKMVRYVQGDQSIPNAHWAHIYGAVGNDPFRPTEWYFTEPTLKGAPLGWDVMQGGQGVLPELLAGPSTIAPMIGLSVGEMAAHNLVEKNYIKEILLAVVIAVASSVLTEIFLTKLKLKHQGRQR